MRQNDPKKQRYSDPAEAEEETVPGLRAGAHPALSRSVQAQIGQRLRLFYDSLALGENPVPDRFIEIINRLDQDDMGRGRREHH